MSYPDSLKFLLDVWLTADGAPKDPRRETGPALGTQNTAVNPALGTGDAEMSNSMKRSETTTTAVNSAPATGDVEMSVDSTERSENMAKSDPLRDLALHLDLISPETRLLSEEERLDLALLEKLNQSQTQLQQVLAVETEIVATERWNFDAVTQLLNLANQMSTIPFASRSELFDLEPTSAESVPAPTGSASKGKGRLGEGPKKRALYHMLPNEARGGWAGSGEPFLFPVFRINS